MRCRSLRPRFNHVRAPSLAAAVFGALVASVAGPVRAQEPFVAVTSIVEQASLDAIRDGLRDALSRAGLAPGHGLRFVFASARADPQAAAAIARRFAGERPNVLVAISTPSAEAALAAAPEVPIVYVAVDPPAPPAGGAPAGPSTGLLLPPPAGELLHLMREYMPGLRRVGFLHGPATPRGDAALARLREAAAGLGIEVADRTMATPEAGRAAIDALAGQSEAMILASDATVARAMPVLVARAEALLKPLFAQDPEQVARGAVAALGYDYAEVGREAAGLVLRVLRGERASDLPVAAAAAGRIIVNIDAAERMGTRAPEAVLARAALIVD